jgi:hypothetical protein
MIPKQKGSNLQVVLWIVAIAGAIAAVVGFRFGVPWFLSRQADRELLKTPAYQQIAKWEPEAYEEMKRQMMASMAQGQPPAVAQGRVRRIVERLANKYMKTADDAALVDYIRTNTDEIRKVADKNTDAAFAILFAGDANVDITTYIDAATQKHDQEALAEVIRSGVAKEAGIQDDQRAKQLLRDVMIGMRRDYGNGVEAALRPASGADKARSVQIALDFYNRVLSLRSDQSAKVLRLLFSKAG